MRRGGPAGPPGSCHSAMTNASLVEPRMCPASGGAGFGGFMVLSEVFRTDLTISGVVEPVAGSGEDGEIGMIG